MDVTVHDLSLSWEACSKKMPVHQTTIFPCTPPLQEVLKLNFNKSFLEVRKGDYGGVISNNFGQVICSLSISVDCINANGAEVFAMLMVAMSYRN